MISRPALCEWVAGRDQPTRDPKGSLVSSQTNSNGTIKMTVTGPRDQIASFVQFCKTVQFCCSVGAGRTVQIDVDGDGSGNLRFDFGGTDVSGVEVPSIDADVIRVDGIGG